MSFVRANSEEIEYGNEHEVDEGTNNLLRGVAMHRSRKTARLLAKDKHSKQTTTRRPDMREPIGTDIVKPIER